ncbi:Hypothetical predicted protein [Pelobates cultripes]|uniref:Dynein heavy chain linker domain-containing protein n=1 Tax=Pelobates cultripes TaxID=61616 RepID=A0AAD1R2V7_PELCU|nr:Hypothetical predicted protein [Pelobates cultripes]
MELSADCEVLFKTMPARWNNMKTKVSLAKQRLGPRIQQEADRVTQDLKRFQHKLDALGQDIETSEVYMYKCTSHEAFRAIEHFNTDVQILQNEAKDLKELQELLETTVVDFSILANCEELLQKLSLVWQHVNSILKEQDTWKKEVWQNMNTEQLYRRTNHHLELLKALPEEVQEWDVYKHTLEAVNIMHLTLPLIEEISHPAMRTRHWNQLVRQTGGLLLVTQQSFKALTLGDLLAMGLESKFSDRYIIDIQSFEVRSARGTLRSFCCLRVPVSPCAERPLCLSACLSIWSLVHRFSCSVSLVRKSIRMGTPSVPFHKLGSMCLVRGSMW